MSIIYIGGSPCSGKSTTVKAIEEKYGLIYFEPDKRLDGYIERAAQEGKSICKKVKLMSPEEIWMRDPEIQCEEEFQIYEEIFDYIMEDLQGLNIQKGVITEAVAFCPKLMKKQGITSNEYLTIVPSSEFQVFHYKQREWIKFVLEGCSDKEKAFDNWMQRDILFAKRVKEECLEAGFSCIVNDGKFSPEELEKKIITFFGIQKV